MNQRISDRVISLNQNNEVANFWDLQSLSTRNLSINTESDSHVSTEYTGRTGDLEDLNRTISHESDIRSSSPESFAAYREPTIISNQNSIISSENHNKHLEILNEVASNERFSEENKEDFSDTEHPKSFTVNQTTPIHVNGSDNLVSKERSPSENPAKTLSIFEKTEGLFSQFLNSAIDVESNQNVQFMIRIGKKGNQTPRMTQNKPKSRHLPSINSSLGSQSRRNRQKIIDNFKPPPLKSSKFGTAPPESYKFEKKSEDKRH